MTPAPAPQRAFVGLGANLGEARAALLQAFDELDRLPGTRCVARSSLYRSAPVDAAGPDFVNAVAELRTTLAPLELLHALQDLEHRHGRERPYRHAPRTLDLDLLLYDDVRSSAGELMLPHPRMHQRAFVLLPLAEVARDLDWPLARSLAECLADTRHQAVERLAR